MTDFSLSFTVCLKASKRYGKCTGLHHFQAAKLDSELDEAVTEHLSYKLREVWVVWSDTQSPGIRNDIREEEMV